MHNSLDVRVHDTIVGTLSALPEKFVFTYSNENSDFISLTMPVRVEQYTHNKLHPIFEMHLPEGYLLSIIKKHFSKLTKIDDFGLLQLMASSVHGRISYREKKSSEKALELKDLLHPSSENLFEELVSRFALRSALSGVQPKVLATIEDKATLKYDDYIVKSWGEEYPELALNEYYCMKILQYSSIEVPEFYISSDEKLFIMKRFDIVENRVKLGFEDMCVLQAKQRDDKYEGSYEQIAKTIKIFVSPNHKKSSLQQFFKMVVINNIIQNGDGHLKNFGLLYHNINDIKISPAYDVVSTTHYIRNDIPALHLLGSKKWWKKKYLIRFALESCDLSSFEAHKLYDECILAAKRVGKEIELRVTDEKKSEKIKLLNHLLGLISTLEI